MPHFTFRLQSLLRLREDRRDECRARLAAAINDDHALAQRQAELEHERRELVAQCREAAAPGDLDVDRLLECRRYDRLLTTERDQLVAWRQQAAERIEQDRETLLAADREVRALEILKTRQQDQHREEAKRREIKTLDEMAATVRSE